MKKKLAELEYESSMVNYCHIGNSLSRCLFMRFSEREMDFLSDESVVANRIFLG